MSVICVVNTNDQIIVSNASRLEEEVKVFDGKANRFVMDTLKRQFVGGRLDLDLMKLHKNQAKELLNRVSGLADVIRSRLNEQDFECSSLSEATECLMRATHRVLCISKRLSDLIDISYPSLQNSELIAWLNANTCTLS